MTLLLAACASATPPSVHPPASPTPAGLFLPTYGALNGRPTALLEGRLIEDHDCLWIEEDSTRWLLLWPPGSSLVQDGNQRVVRNGGQRAAVGTQVSAGGGEYGDVNYAFVVELIGEEVPAPCRTAGLYWLGHDVQTLAR